MKPVIIVGACLILLLSGFSVKPKRNYAIEHIEFDVGRDYIDRAFSSYFLERRFYGWHNPFVLSVTAAEGFEADPNAYGTPDGWPEWLPVPVGEDPLATPGITSGNIDSGIDDSELLELDSQLENISDSERLARIDYHLSVISGGVILAVCGWFCWYTVIKPLKSFIRF